MGKKTTEYKLIGYVGSGEITESDVKKLTHINIAFGGLVADGTVTGAQHDKVRMIPQFKKWNPDIKVLLSFVAAPGESNSFAVCSADETLRKKAADSMAKLCLETGLDGIDLDWE